MLQSYSALDSPPPMPPDRVKPGDDTMSLLGAPNADGEGAGISASTPTGRALSGVMMMMQGVNEIESVVPGAIPPPILQLIQQLSLTIPETVRNMQMTNTGPGMLSTIGMGMMGGGPTQGQNPMSGMPGMGGGGGAGASMFGEGSPRNPMAGM